ncbi:MAG: rod shape-determining protein MreD [Bacteroidetes bacterium CG2_30_32_10]|nr:MAG: rod shape-determining protein MreD [Bacteroidetes bacterium CG2_30_32_10]
MNNNLIIINVLRFFALILLQVLVLNNIQFSGYINPYVYVLFILMLPVQTPGWIVLISSFLLGISIDMFSDSLGLHATASVLIAFIRPNIINILSAKEAFVAGAYPVIKYYSLKWFLTYALILVLIHHSILFYLEIFAFREFFHTFLQVIASSTATLILIIIGQYMFYKPIK